MTPRAADWRSVRPKLRKIEGLLETLDGLVGVDGATLRRDTIQALAVERALTLVVELAFAVNSHLVVALAARAPDTYAESFELVARVGVIDEELGRALVPSAKMRNVLVHAYLDVDHDIVAAALPLAVRQYGEYVRQVAAWFTARTSDS